MKDVALTCCGNPHGDVEQRWVGGKRYGWWVTGWWVTVHIVDGSIVHAIAPYEGGGQWFAGLGWLLR